MELKTYRGHIRNWQELCETLDIAQTLSREEREEAILLRAYAKWGYEIADHLNGMFAFAIYDEDKDELFCVRDQFGTKPFYYYVTEDGRLLYGTMIRDILDQDGFVKEINEKMLQIYMSLTYVAGEDTFFKGVKKLMPGHYLVFRGGKAKLTRYFAPRFAPQEGKSLQEWADEIHATVKTIMTEVKTEDETAESFLSGGVDSSYVLAMSDAKAADSCGYDNPKFDESVLAQETAQILGRSINRLVVQPEDFFGIVPYTMYHMEQPLGDASAIVFTLGCNATAEHTKLCYSGEGSDEFWGGYNIYRNAERYAPNLDTFYVGNTNIMKEDEKERILKHYDPSYLPINLVKDIYEENKDEDPLSRMLDIDIRIWLEGDIYLNVDKMSTAAGLEIRMPLTDRRLFDIASRMPAEFKINETENKVAFRTAAAKVLPEEVAFRKKLGFIVPIRLWLADERYNGDVVAKFNSEAADRFFNKEEILKIFDAYIAGDSDLWRKVWTIYTFLVWYEEYFEKR